MPIVRNQIIDNSRDALAIIENGPGFPVLGMNTHFCADLHLESEQAPGQLLFELAGVDVPREKYTSILEAIHRTGYAEYCPVPGGSEFIFSKLLDPEGDISLVRLINRKAEYDVLAYANLFERNQVGVYQSAIDGTLLNCNLAFAHLLGYESPADLVGFNTIRHYYIPQRRIDYLDQLQQNPSLRNFEIKILRADGEVVECLENSYLEILPNGFQQISGTLMDITDRKKVEQALLESEQRFKALAHVTHECVVFCDEEHIIDCNDQFAQLLGYYDRSDIVNKSILDFIPQSDFLRIKTSIGISNNNQSEVRINDLNNRLIVLEVTGSNIMHGGRPSLVLTMNDISARKRAEFALEQSVVRFRNLLENSPNGVIILTDGVMKYGNHAACELLGVEDEDDLYDESFTTFIDVKYRAEIEKDLELIRNGSAIEYKEITLIRSNMTHEEVGIKCILTIYESKPSIQLTLNSVSIRNQLTQEQMRVRLIEEINKVLKQEIEEHKRTQEKLSDQQKATAEQKAKLESILNSTENLLMWTSDLDLRLTTLNRNFSGWMETQFGATFQLGDDAKEALVKYLDLDLYQGQLSAIDNAIKGRPQQFEFALLNTHKETIWMQAFLNPVYQEEELTGISCVMFDNSERRAVDRRVRDSLKEKEVLLQEVHHRVKNNLQVISSILSLQSSYVSDESTLRILQESQERITAMSFIHETLYRTADFSKLEFTDYIRTIAGNLVQSYRISETLIHFEADLDNVYLNLDQSIPCGLIVNELISNALKYAFKNKAEGVLRLCLKQYDNEIMLEVSDDGVGLGEDFKFEKHDSLGIQLVYSLVEQLDGSLEVKSEKKKGTCFTLSFTRH
jgi:PAS domain S-box-containing protein